MKKLSNSFLIILGCILLIYFGIKFVNYMKLLPVKIVTDIKAIYSNDDFFVGIKNNGKVVVWEASNLAKLEYCYNIPDQLTDIKDIYSNHAGFVALKEDGSVVSWGHLFYLIEFFKVESELNHVKKIYPSDNAFVALKEDGTVVTWGNFRTLKDEEVVVLDKSKKGKYNIFIPAKLDHVKEIYPNKNAFAALKENGTVVTWGSVSDGGNSSSVQSKLNHVKEIYTSYFGGFAALKEDGSVVSWMYPNVKVSSSDQDKFRNIKKIYPNHRSFIALKEDGTLFEWEWGTDRLYIREVSLDNVKEIYFTTKAFATLKEDGSVVTWGDSGYGGSPASCRPGGRYSFPTCGISVDLKNIKEIYPNESAFAAIKEDGTVVTWGNSYYGGDSSSVKSKLKKVKKIYSSYFGGFAALKEDGTVVSWGQGSFPKAKKYLKNIIDIVPSEHHVGGYYFAALREDGTVISW